MNYCSVMRNGTCRHKLDLISRKRGFISLASAFQGPFWTKNHPIKKNVLYFVTYNFLTFLKVKTAKADLIVQTWFLSRYGFVSSANSEDINTPCTLLHYLLSGPATLFADEGLSATVCWRHLWLDPCLITSLVAEHTYRTASHIWTVFVIWAVRHKLYFKT